MPRALLKAVYSGVSRANQLLQQMFQVLQEVAAPAEAPAPAATGYRSNMANGGIPVRLTDRLDVFHCLLTARR